MSKTWTKPLRILVFHLYGRPLRKFLYLSHAWTKTLRELIARVSLRHARFMAVLNVNVDLSSKNRTKATAMEVYKRHMHALLPKFEQQPLISVLVPVYKVKPEFLAEALESVAAQIYRNWEICIVDDASGDDRITDVVERFKAKLGGKVKLAINDQNKHISATSNRCLELATGDYTALLDHDDRLYPNALAEFVRSINYNDEPDVLYSDEEVIDERGGAKASPFFKPDWSPFLHLSVNYTTHLSMYKTNLLRKIGGFREGFEGAQDHDLMLRACEATDRPVVHIPFCLYQWRAHEQSTASSLDSKSYAIEAGIKTVDEACKRQGRKVAVSFDSKTLHYRMKFALPDPLPLVSIIIPSRDCFEPVRICLNSLFEKSSYQNFEVILVDNDTQDQNCLDLFKALQAKHGDRFRNVRKSGTFNFAALNNLGVQESRGQHLVLLNNDTEIITPDWIQELLMYSQFPEIGAVGCKLLYPNNTLQHAGLVLVGRGIADSALRDGPGDCDNYISMAQTVHECSCVTAACLMVEREKFESAGGFDEIYVPNGYGDVDLCLKLGEEGLNNIYTPHARLYHYESKTRGAQIENFERALMFSKWGRMLLADPYLNPNLKRNGKYEIDPEFIRPEMTRAMFRDLLRPS